MIAMRFLGRSAVLLLALAQPALPQVLCGTLWGSFNTGAGGGFGLATLHDLNGDGIPEFVMGSPAATVGGLLQAGAVEVFAGFNAPLATQPQKLLVIVGLHEKDRLGWSIADLGDIDGDGKSDIAVGAPQSDAQGSDPAGNGYVAVYSGATGQLIWQTVALDTGAAIAGLGNGFGFSVSALGDINGDGLAELLVGAPFFSLDSEAFVAVLSGSNGSEIARIHGVLPTSVPQGGGKGLFVRGIGDFDQDGVPDGLIGLGGNIDGGAIVVSGAILATCGSIGCADMPLVSMPWACAAIPCPVGKLYAFPNAGIRVGDLDHDGIDDFVIADYSASIQLDPNLPPKILCGIVQVRSGATGLPLGPEYEWIGEQAEEFFGTALASGQTMLAAGSGFTLLTSAARASGHIGTEACGRVLAMAGNPPQPIYQLYGMGALDEFGVSIAEAGDLNLDGSDDYLIGGWQISPFGSSGPGYVQVWLGGPGPWVRGAGALGGDNGLPNMRMDGPPVANGPITMRLTDVAPSKAVVIFGSVNSMPHQSMKGGVLVPAAQIVLPGLASDIDGQLTLNGTWPAGVPSGLVPAFQAWIKDPTGPKSVTASNAVYATTP